MSCSIPFNVCCFVSCLEFFLVVYFVTEQDRVHLRMTTKDDNYDDDDDDEEEDNDDDGDVEMYDAWLSTKNRE